MKQKFKVLAVKFAKIITHRSFEFEIIFVFFQLILRACENVRRVFSKDFHLSSVLNMKRLFQNPNVTNLNRKSSLNAKIRRSSHATFWGKALECSKSRKVLKLESFSWVAGFREDVKFSKIQKFGNGWGLFFCCSSQVEKKSVNTFFGSRCTCL